MFRFLKNVTNSVPFSFIILHKLEYVLNKLTLISKAPLIPYEAQKVGGKMLNFLKDSNVSVGTLFLVLDPNLACVFIFF